jgi:hypothetical protein
MAVGHFHPQRHVRPTIQGCSLVCALRAFGTSVAAAVYEVGTRSSTDLNQSKTSSLHCFEKSRPQGPHALSVELGGVRALSFTASTATVQLAPVRPSTRLICSG